MHSFKVAIALPLIFIINGCDDNKSIVKSVEMYSGAEIMIDLPSGKFISSNVDVVKASGSRMRAFSPGSATLSAKEGNTTYTLNVTVRPARLYSIGNSHTWDLKPSDDLVKLAKFNGVVIDNDWHIYCNHNIQNIINEPDVTCVPPKHDTYKNAINNVSYDIITIQPFMHGNINDEVNSVKELIREIRASKSHTAKIYIYYTWSRNDTPKLDGMDYGSIWFGNIISDGKLINNGKYFLDYLKLRLSQDEMHVNGFISEGDLLDRFDRLAKDGEVDGFSGAGELYRDNLHMTNIGRYIIARQFLSRIFNMKNVEYAPGTYLPGQYPDRDATIPKSILSMGVF